MPLVHPENLNRAHWAKAAIDAFGLEMHGRAFDRLGEEDQHDVISDLMCNIRHFCLQSGFDFAELDRRGAGNFEHESAPEYAGD